MSEVIDVPLSMGNLVSMFVCVYIYIYIYLHMCQCMCLCVDMYIMCMNMIVSCMFIRAHIAFVCKL